MLIKSAKFIIQITNLATVCLLVFALCHQPEAGFSVLAQLAVAALVATQCSLQKAWKVEEKSKSALKAAYVTALVMVSLTCSATGFLAGAEYSGLEDMTGLVVMELTNEQEMTAIAGAFKSHLDQASQTL